MVNYLVYVGEDSRFTWETMHPAVVRPSILNTSIDLVCLMVLFRFSTFLLISFYVFSQRWKKSAHAAIIHGHSFFPLSGFLPDVFQHIIIRCIQI